MYVHVHVPRIDREEVTGTEIENQEGRRGLITSLTTSLAAVRGKEPLEQRGVGGLTVTCTTYWLAYGISDTIKCSQGTGLAYGMRGCSVGWHVCVLMWGTLYHKREEVVGNQVTQTGF